MNTEFIENYNIVKRINENLSKLSTKEVYSDLNRQSTLLQMRIESMFIAVHITEHDYLGLRRDIKRNLSEIVSIASVLHPNDKDTVKQIKTDVKALFECYDKKYIKSEKHSSDKTI